MKKHKLFTVAGFAISIVLLYFSLRGVEFREIVETLRKADYRHVFTPLGFIAISVVLCSFRWAKLAGNNTRFTDTFIALMIGLFVNNVLPARIGEAARGYVLSRKRRISFTYSLSTVLLDRLFDLAGLLILTFVFFPKQGLPPRVTNAIYMLIGLLIICVVVIFSLSGERLSRKISEKLISMNRPVMVKLGTRLLEIQENLKRIRSIPNLILCIVLSVAIWFSMSLSLYFVILSLGVSIKFSYVPFVCAILNMGLTIPSSPGYVGVYQFLIVYLLAIFGVPKYQGFAVSLIFHAMWFIPYNIVGFIFSLKEHVKMREIQKLEEESP